MNHVHRWAQEGLEFVQVREKELATGELVKLVVAMRAALREKAETKLLVNGRPDVAVVAGADGVHLSLQEGELTVEQVRQVFATAGAGTPVIGVSCHTIDEVKRAVADGVDLILFGPVFEKRVKDEAVGEGVGLDVLQEACEAADGIPVLALGGVSWGSAELCIEAGASGVAGIRMFG
jgi:thiamine-phosphate pyrophosphorylase